MLKRHFWLLACCLLPKALKLFSPLVKEKARCKMYGNVSKHNGNNSLFHFVYDPLKNKQCKASE